MALSRPRNDRVGPNSSLSPLWLRTMSSIDLQAGGVQGVGRRAHLGPAARRETRVGRAEHDGVVAPGVRQAERREVALVDEGVGRHDLDRGDAETLEMLDHRRVGEAGEAFRALPSGCPRAVGSGRAG